MMKEIFQSKLFSVLFEEKPQLFEIVKQKVIPVQGDLSADGLGIASEMR